MEIKATQRYIRQAPRKVRLVANTVKDLSLEEAIRQLAVIPRAATIPVLKTLRLAVANAVHNHGLSPADLRIKELIVNDGAILKRWRAVSRGRSHSINKKTCHVAVTLATIENAVATTPAKTTKTEKVAMQPVAAEIKEKAPVVKKTAATKKETVATKKAPTKKTVK
ncbi:50S ribosomal protein L22 [Candidatus Woesebacteria bacterium]|nr:50S ribosomal protein L22 [Candidatus Woesebacteria bacterium]